MDKHILLVEDELLTAMDVEDSLREAGWDVDGPFTSVRSTLSYLEQNRPACAVLDVRLDDGEVFPAADVLVEAGVPIIFHSGHAGRHSLSSRYPNAAFCDKPSLPEALVRAVRRALETGNENYVAEEHKVASSA
ncbi:response regulator [Devosia chinhatensis]|uniref:Response regulatory domain-containing protein n=1 Tax=Devosia chinhatensis TaxID=429727 RepID=A0A0F5FEU0_9HYPH|nr:response regulator [Devosia chinhatensis]KKB07376.1 hypothetical protein VE26_11390 [Devosia chinhatensis]